MMTPQPPRRRLTDKLDFICFVSILLLCAALAVVISTAQRTTLLNSVWLVVPIVPLAFWLSVMTRLRRYLEDSENEARRGRLRHALTLKKTVFARSMGAAA